MFAEYAIDENYVPVLKRTYVSPEMVLIRLEALIEAHYKEQKQPAFYAGKLCYGLRALNNLCRQHYGATVFALVQARVLLEAKRLALCTAMPVKQICFELGFNNTVHFCRFFKKREGMGLREWRRVQGLKIAATKEKQESKT